MDDIGSSVSRVIQRPDADVLHFLFIFVVASDVAFLVRMNVVPITRIGHNKAALAAAGDKPIFAADHAGIGATGDADIRIVLLRPINVIWECIVHSDMIELRSWLVVLGRPRFAAIGRDIDAAIIRITDPMGILRIDPETVMVSVPRWQQAESFSAIDRAEKASV